MLNPTTRFIKTSSPSNDKKPTIYRVYSYRFVVLGLFTMATFVNTLMWGTYAPLMTQMMGLFNQSITIVSLCTIVIINTAFLAGNFLANFIIDQLGIRIGILTAAALTAVGMWINRFSSYNFYWILVGQSLGGVAQAFFYGTSQKLFIEWFPKYERILATALMIGILPIGAAVGTLIPQFFVDTKTTSHDTIYQIEDLMTFQASISISLFILMLLLFKERPPTPPSCSPGIKKMTMKEYWRLHSD